MEQFNKAKWSSKKLIDASLEDYSIARLMGQSHGKDPLFLDLLFGSNGYSSTEEYMNLYGHNTAQFIMKEFFEKIKGLSLIPYSDRAYVQSGLSEMPVLEDIDCDLGKTFKGYKTGWVAYQKGDDKVAIHMERHDENDVFYTIYASSKYNHIMLEWKEYAKKNNLYKGKKVNGACQFLDLQSVTWDDVILPDGIKGLLQSMVKVSEGKEEIYKKNGLTLKRGIMLEGGAGHGKSTAIKAIIKETTLSVIYALPSHLESSHHVRNVCKMAREVAPCILVIEDIDWLAEDRDSSSDPGKVIELMNQLDGVEGFESIITIATTNAVDKIENAIKNRPGRFDRVIKIPNPDAKCRAKMIKVFSNKLTLDESIDIPEIVKFTKGLSGAHLRDLCSTAAKLAIDEGSLGKDDIAIVKEEHFEAAIKEVKNKDYSTYMKLASKGESRPMGFASEMLRGDD